MSDTVLTFDGITQPITEWALDYGIYPEVISDRLARGWTVERAITMPMVVVPHQRLKPEHLPGLPAVKRKPIKISNIGHRRIGRRAALIEHDGLSLTMSEWADRLGLSVNGLRSRLKRGITFEQAVNIGHRQPGKRAALIEHDGLSLTMSEWAERNGLRTATIRRRINNGWPIGLALTRPSIPGKQGVVSDFAEPSGTGAGSVAQDIPQIEFSK